MTHGHDEGHCCHGHGHSHAHGHGHHHGCGNHEGECCQHEDEHEDDQDFAHELIAIADDAWMELLHEKIKKEIEKADGANLDKLAKLVSDANRARWNHKLALNKNSAELKNSLDQFFGQAD